MEDAGMPHITLITTCHSCGMSYPKTSVLKCLLHHYRIHCKICGATTVSQLGWRSIVLMGIYTQVMATLLSIPTISGILSGHWAITSASLLVFGALVFPPAMFLHARKATSPS
jgi:hypothetical protein